MDLGLKGRRALITGASKGIGAATAEILAQEGCHLRLAARGPEALDDLAARLSATYGVDCQAHPTDLRNPQDLQRLAREAADIDILVNNAGDIPRGSLDMIDEATWRHAWELKVFGYINLTRLIYPQLKARGKGVILNVIGSGGESQSAGYIAGAAGNASLMAFTRAMGGRSLADNIRVLGLNPGYVETDRGVYALKINAKQTLGDENRWREMTSGFPYGRGAKPQEIADLLAFMASDRSAYTTGVIFTVDGGFVARQGQSL